MTKELTPKEIREKMIGDGMKETLEEFSLTKLSGVALLRLHDTLTCDRAAAGRRILHSSGAALLEPCCAAQAGRTHETRRKAQFVNFPHLSVGLITIVGFRPSARSLSQNGLMRMSCLTQCEEPFEGFYPSPDLTHLNLLPRPP